MPIAIFPLQELGKWRNDVNLPLSEALAERLTEDGGKIIYPETVIAFMANNRIRTVGHLEAANISKVRRDLGAAFVLLGTVSQRKERPEPTLGLTLSLVRTSDVRIIWSYVGSISTGEERRMLGIGEPRSTADLQELLLEEVARQWPWDRVNEVQQAGTINIDSVILEPKIVPPGAEVTSRVRLREGLASGQEPRVFFRVRDQLYPAQSTEAGSSYEATWVAGEEDGRYPVTLLVEWPEYRRAETALLGSYLIDGTPPLFELEMRGAKIFEGRPVFDGQLVIVPQMIVRKPLDRWRLSFYYGDEEGALGDMEGAGNLPRSIIWKGMRGAGDRGDGTYRVKVEAWDEAGNKAQVTETVEMLRSMPEVELAVSRAEEDLVVDLGYEGKVPLRYWRLEMWTKEGRILSQSEGKDLPAKFEVELPDSGQTQQVEGFLFYQDVLGKQVRKRVPNLLPSLSQDPVKKKEEEKGISESWVPEF